MHVDEMVQAMPLMPIPSLCDKSQASGTRATENRAWTTRTGRVSPAPPKLPETTVSTPVAIGTAR